jgi:putative ABC transport system permease protein
VSAIGGFKPKVFLPMSMKPVVQARMDDLEDRRSRWATIVARLKPGVSEATAAASLQPLWKSLRAEELKSIDRTTPRFRQRFVEESELKLTDDSKGFSPLRDTMRTPLRILMGMVLLLAAMTCVNLTSLLLVRAAARTREFAVRFALGAARARILRQVLIEGLLLGVVGGGLGLALAPTVAAVLARRITDGEVPFSVAPGGVVLWFNVLLSVGVSVLFSLAPAMQMMNPKMNEGLRQQASSTLAGAQRFRRVAIAVQIGLSVLLLSGAGLFLRTLHNLKGQSMGIATDHLVEFGLDPSLAGYDAKDVQGVLKRVQDGLAAAPGVRFVGATTDPVLAGNSQFSSMGIEGYAAGPDENLDMESPYVTPGYFRTMGIPMLAGRDVDDADVSGGQKVVVVSRGFAVKYFGGVGQAVGHSVSDGPNEKMDKRIVGVVGDAKQHGVRDAATPMVYHAFAQLEMPSGVEFYVRTTQEPELAEYTVRAVLRQVDAKLVIDTMRTMDEQIDDNVSQERLIALLAMSFALIALLTTAVGLYGVLAYATAQRTKEIGIRMALGAQRSGIVRLVLSDMGKIALVGIAVALPLSVAMTRLVRSELFGVSPFDPLTLLGCVGLTVAMVLAAAALPARRAATVEPTVALRTE